MRPEPPVGLQQERSQRALETWARGPGLGTFLGAYYMISSSLGLEIGGAIGVPLFLAQTFSVTLYAFGLAEVLQLSWPGVSATCRPWSWCAPRGRSPAS
jgi:hypothetical protein